MPQILSLTPCSSQPWNTAPVKKNKIKYPLTGSYSPSRAAQRMTQSLGHLPSLPFGREANTRPLTLPSDLWIISQAVLKIAITFFPPFQTSRERQVEEEEREKSLLHLQLSHPTAPELMWQVNISSALVGVEEHQRQRERQRERE